MSIRDTLKKSATVRQVVSTGRKVKEKSPSAAREFVRNPGKTAVKGVKTANRAVVDTGRAVGKDMKKVSRKMHV